MIPAGSGEGRRITPGVVVERKEITALIRGTAVHVLGHLETVRIDIRGRVSNGNLAVSTSGDVASHVTGDGLDVGSAGGGGIIVDDLVSGEEGQHVGVVGKRIDGRKDVLEVDGVVRGVGIGTIERVQGRVDVEHQVDSSRCQRVHAGIVVGGVIDRVDTDGVDSQLLELHDVSRAGGCVCNGVDQLGGSTWLVIDTADIESAASLEESCTLLAIRASPTQKCVLAYHCPWW